MHVFRLQRLFQDGVTHSTPVWTVKIYSVI